MSYRKPTRYTYCPRCAKYIGVKLDGTLYRHGPMNQPCSGTNLRIRGNKQTADPKLSRRPTRGETTPHGKSWLAG